jgi:cytochrome c556
MTRFILIAAFAVVLSWTAALAHKGHEHATGVVRERMELMTDMGERLLAISKRLRANKELDRIAADARAIKDASGKLTSQFPPGSTQFPTAAKPVATVATKHIERRRRLDSSRYGQCPLLAQSGHP